MSVVVSVEMSQVLVVDMAGAMSADRTYISRPSGGGAWSALRKTTSAWTDGRHRKAVCW
jgi:hypothetical protein